MMHPTGKTSRAWEAYEAVMKFLVVAAWTAAGLLAIYVFGAGLQAVEAGDRAVILESGDVVCHRVTHSRMECPAIGLTCRGVGSMFCLHD